MTSSIKTEQQRLYRYLFYLRRLSQSLFLAAFLFLFIRTDYSGADSLEYVVNILFRLDPFLAAVTMLAGRTIIALMLPSVVVLLLALFLGRSFCGWFCPLGSLLDGCRSVISTDVKGKKTLYPRLGKWLFFTAVLCGLFGFHIAGYIDPFSLLVRGLAQAVYPAFHGVSEGFFSYTYSTGSGFVNAVTEPLYSWMKDTILPADRKYFELAYLSLFLLGSLFLFEILQKRFFCRNICPLGAMLGMVSSHGLLKATGGADACGKCRVCATICRMGAIDDKRGIDMTTCNLCIECAVKCPKKIISFTFARRKTYTSTYSLSRRHFMGIVATGVILPSVKGVGAMQQRINPLLIRPPGAIPEEEFTGRCVRCGECYQVCIGNALQPTLLEGGLDAIFTPKLVARTGYCELNCTLCGQVCPTGAIRQLTMQEKHTAKIGLAWFDKNRCLPFAKNISCIVCEEHCPTAEKAIRFKDVDISGADGEKIQLKQPYVVDDLCIGCGICEYKCPLPGQSAIIVTSANEDRNPEKSIPSSTKSPYG